MTPPACLSFPTLNCFRLHYNNFDIFSVFLPSHPLSNKMSCYAFLFLLLRKFHPTKQFYTHLFRRCILTLSYFWHAFICIKESDYNHRLSSNTNYNHDITQLENESQLRTNKSHTADDDVYDDDDDDDNIINTLKTFYMIHTRALM